MEFVVVFNALMAFLLTVFLLQKISSIDKSLGRLVTLELCNQEPESLKAYGEVYRRLLVKKVVIRNLK